MVEEKGLIAAALELGFANAAVVDTAELVFVPGFRPLCAENLCGKYGVNYACPPDCGSVEEMKGRVLVWRRALVLQSMWDIRNPMDSVQVRPAKGAHNRMTRQLIDGAGEPGLMIGASGCSLCEPCALVAGEPCRFPDQRFSCLSAYCIFVKELAERCGMEYDCGPGITAFFSLFCFGPR